MNWIACSTILLLPYVVGCSFKVRERRSDHTINVVIDPIDSESIVGSSVTLSCVVDGDIYCSSCRSWEYPENANPSNFLTEDDTLTIKSLAPSDAGEYGCRFIQMTPTFKKGMGKAIVNIKPEKPGQPQNLRVVTFDGDAITLTWEAGVDGYAETLYFKLEYMTEDSSWTKLQDIQPGKLEFTVSNLALETSYRFRITQVNKVGESFPSDPTSSVYLPKRGAVSVHPNLLRLEPFNSTTIRVFWSMPEFSEVVTEWFIEHRPYQGEQSYKSVSVNRNSLDTHFSLLKDLEENKKYQIRMYCKNDYGRGPPSPTLEITTSEAPPSAPPRNVRVDYKETDGAVIIMWSPPPLRDQNGDVIGYKVKIYFEAPGEGNSTQQDTPLGDTTLTFPVAKENLPVWVCVAAMTKPGIGPFSGFVQLAELAPPTTEKSATGEILNLLKQPWILAIIAVLLLVFIVMISIIICRQQKIKKRKLQQAQHPPLFNSYHSSINSSMNGQYRMRDDGPQYEKIPDSRTTTPQGSNRSYDGRVFDNRSTPNSFVDNRHMPPPNYRDLSLDSQRYSMSQNSSVDDLASTVPSVTYSLPNARDGYKVVNPTSNDRGPQNTAIVAPQKAKEQDPNIVKPKVYGNITVKEWREQQQRRKKGEGTSDNSLLSSFGKDSGRGSTDNVSISGSDSDEGSDIEKYLEEDYSPRNSGYIEDDLMDVARMGMSRSPPESKYLHGDHGSVGRGLQPRPANHDTYHADDATSIESDLYMQCDNQNPEVQLPNAMYHLNGGVSEIDD